MADTAASPSPSSSAAAPPPPPVDVLEEFARHRSAFLDGQAQVEGLVTFVKERVAMEESYAKSLSKLSKHSLSIDGEREKPRGPKKKNT